MSNEELENSTSNSNNKIEFKFINNKSAIQLLTILNSKKFYNLFRYENQVLLNNVLTFVDNEADPNIVLNIDIFRGQISAFPLNLESLLKVSNSIDWNNGFLTKFKNDSNINWDEIFERVGKENRNGLEKHLKLTEKISFACITHEFEPFFVKSLSNHFKNITEDIEVFDALTLKIDNVEAKINELKLNLDGNEGLLKYEDAETVNDKWQYKSNESINFLRWSCVQPISGAYRVNGELVSWIIMYSDGSIGSLYTLDSARGKGYAKKVVSFILIKLLENGFKLPYCFVRDNNVSSQKVMRSFGFNSDTKVKWVFNK